ncbi:GrpB family protein [Rhizobium sp. YIM 134829]|uniref:GrpB family protein n=1 Tax=Rhizobium sp. YIM 134829 TaxID=3390453 RepID=UPI00397B3C60
MPITIVPYDPDWPLRFVTEASVLERQLAPWFAAAHHIGSTAVPGLAAKPKLDIDIVLVSEAALPLAIAVMQQSGTYRFHGSPYQDGRWSFTASREGYGLRLSLCGPDNPDHARRILFRDYLRAQPGVASAYEQLKRRLAAEAADDWDVYTGGKTQFIEDAIRSAIASQETLEVNPETRAPDGGNAGA